MTMDGPILPDGEFTVNEMLRMQQALQDQYRQICEGISPAIGQNKRLWMVGEIGEVIDIVKKNGGENASRDPALRSRLTEEMCDVLMYFCDTLLCYGISSQELKRAYVEKFQRNMKRW